MAPQRPGRRTHKMFSNTNTERRRKVVYKKKPDYMYSQTLASVLIPLFIKMTKVGLTLVYTLAKRPRTRRKSKLFFKITAS